ncbi:MAG: hypothetical protein JWM82_519 [Myxococcales bacterium]|nr:hypothetical protein [Myxococcales bacterium]
MSSPQKIYPYDPPRALAENLWQVTGSLPFPVPRNMTVWRAPDGRLVLYSVVAMHENGMRALEALGTPAYMVIPHLRHHMDAPFYKARYPAMRVLAVAREPANGVPVDGPVEELDTLGVRGGRIPGTDHEHHPLDHPIAGGRAICVCELLGNVAPQGALQRLAARLIGPPGGGCGLARIVRLREVRDRPRLRAWFAERARRTDLLMLLMGHGMPVLGQAEVAAALARAATQA